MTDADSFRGVHFVGQDFRGATWRDSDLSEIRIVDCYLLGVTLSGEIDRVVVNDVDVTAYVEGELDRRHPERAVVRTAQSAAELRAAWVLLGGLWDELVARAAQWPEAVPQSRVDDEWSLVETLRHLLFATDAWVGRAVLDEEDPYHPLGLPADGYPADDAAAIGLDLAARPTFADVLAARATRHATVTTVLGAITDAELDRVCRRAPGPGYPDEERTVRRCLRVVLREECEHHRYMVRDLAALT